MDRSTASSEHGVELLAKMRRPEGHTLAEDDAIEGRHHEEWPTGHREPRERGLTEEDRTGEPIGQCVDLGSRPSEAPENGPRTLEQCILTGCSA